MLDLLELYGQHQSRLENDLVEHERLREALKLDIQLRKYNCRHRHSVGIVTPCPDGTTTASSGVSSPLSGRSRSRSRSSVSHLLHLRDSLTEAASTDSNHPHPPCVICAAASPLQSAWIVHKADGSYRSDRRRTEAEQKAEEALIFQEMTFLNEMETSGGSSRRSAVSAGSAGTGARAKSRIRSNAVTGTGSKPTWEKQMPIVLEACPPGVQPVRPLPEGKRMVLDDD